MRVSCHVVCAACAIRTDEHETCEAGQHRGMARITVPGGVADVTARARNCTALVGAVPRVRPRWATARGTVSVWGRRGFLLRSPVDRFYAQKRMGHLRLGAKNNEEQKLALGVLFFVPTTLKMRSMMARMRSVGPRWLPTGSQCTR